jgi:predicted transcriptional regulator
MSLIPAQEASPERDTLSLRVDRALHAQLKAYAEFIESSKDYVICQALHRVFRQDKDFAAWLAARSTGGPTPEAGSVLAAEGMDATSAGNSKTCATVPTSKRSGASGERR